MFFEKWKSGLKAFFGSIKARFICYFLVGMTLTVIFSSAISYNVIYYVIHRINQKTAKVEFTQISTNMNFLYESLDRQLTALIMSKNMSYLIRRGRDSQIDYIQAVKNFSHDVDAMQYNFDYIYSTYVYLDNGASYCFSLMNSRMFFHDYDPIRSKKVNSLIENADKKTSISSGIYPSDLQYADKSKPNVLVACVSRKFDGGTIVIYIDEKQLSNTYSGIAANDNCKLRLLDNSGRIISSNVPDEVGSLYAQFSLLSDAERGDIAFKSDKNTQLLWYKDSDIIIAKEISTSEYWRDLSLIWTVILIVFFLGVSITCVTFFIWMNKTFRPIKMLTNSMSIASSGNYDVTLEINGQDEISIIAQNYNDMLHKLHDLDINNKKVENEKRNSELKALRNQINPHFLFNTLNMIKWMALVNSNNNIANCITALGQIISPIINAKNSVCTLAEELDIIVKYLEIINMRYGNGIVFKQEIDDELKNANVLRLILQPIAENSVIHGFKENCHHGILTLSAKRCNEKLIITLTDNGVGMSDEALSSMNNMLQNTYESDGIGVMNTNRRIFLSYGAPYGIRMAHNPFGGLSTIITLPLEITNP